MHPPIYQIGQGGGIQDKDLTVRHGLSLTKARSDRVPKRLFEKEERTVMKRRSLSSRPTLAFSLQSESRKIQTNR